MMNSSSELPKYYAVNDRPVKLIDTAEGGQDVLVMNLKTGEFERDMSYGDHIHAPFKDVDQFTEAEFDDYVATLRQTIVARNV
jgi:hypothetical protein